jgi:hypothetical protein
VNDAEKVKVKEMIFNNAVKIYCAVIANPLFFHNLVDSYGKDQVFAQCLRDSKRMIEVRDNTSFF